MLQTKKRKDEPCVRLNVLYIEPKLFGEFFKNGGA